MTNFSQSGFFEVIKDYAHYEPCLFAMSRDIIHGHSTGISAAVRDTPFNLLEPSRIIGIRRTGFAG
jgi:hypothetical protein